MKKPLLSLEEEQTLGRLIRAGDVAARSELVNRNYGYINRMTQRYAYICKDEDLRQEMVLGLIEAATKYDPDRGCKFLTIAQHYVRKYALLYLAQRGLVFVPALMRKEGPRSDAKSVRAKARFELAATSAEIAMRRPLYLGAYPRDGDDIVGAEREQDHSPVPTDELMAAIHQLSPLEQAVICGRFGIGCPKETGKSIAKRYSLHPQKIVNIKRVALRKLRQLIDVAA